MSTEKICHMAGFLNKKAPEIISEALRPYEDLALPQLSIFTQLG